MNQGDPNQPRSGRTFPTTRLWRGLVLTTVVSAALWIAGCGGGASESAGDGFGLGDGARGPAGAAGPAESPGSRGSVQATVVVEKRVEVTRVVEKEKVVEKPAAAPAQPGLVDDSAFGRTPAQLAAQQLEQAVAQQAIQERIIVRTVDMGISVGDVSRTIEDISATARRVGGWVVSSDRSEKHRGHIAVRVPADKLDATLTEIRAYAIDVESETSSSKDVTDEYVDLSSRLRNLEATEQALVKLLDKATTVEDALKVQTELSRIQGQIEEAQGRIKFLQETSAYSLVNVAVRREPVNMSVDGGADRTISVGQTATFTARLRPPDGIDQFTITWNFGDGTGPVTTDRTAPTLEKGVLVTASIGHAYFDEKGSPYIVEVKITGTGDAGTAEGADTMIATVSRLPVIDVFVGNDRTVTEGEQVEFRASFTRPQGVEDLRYEWEFGDGSAGTSGAVAPGVTEAVQSHVFEHHRPQPFAVTIKLLGESAAGKVEASDTVQVFVRESPNWLGGRWDFGDTTRTATRAISQVAEVAIMAGIWLLIFSPVLALAAFIAIVATRASRRRRMARQSSTETTGASVERVE